MSSDEQQMKILKELGGPRMYNNYTYIPENLSCFRRNEILSELIPYIEQLESIVDRSVTGSLLSSSLIYKELKAMKAVRARLEDTSNTPSCSIMGGRRRKSHRRKSHRRKSYRRKSHRRRR
jgi:hypothetical protein